MRKVRRKKKNIQTMLLGEYSVRTEKTPQQHKSTYTIDTRHSHRGSESGPASSNPVPQPLIRCWSDPLDRLAVQSERRRVVGGGAMSVGWGRKQERLTALLSRGRFQQQPCQGHCVGEPEKDKIVLSLGQVNAFQFCVTLSVHFGLQYNQFSFVKP